MTRDYFIAIIESGLLDKFNWYREMFTIPLGTKHTYITVDGSDVIIVDTNEHIKLDDTRLTPLLLSDTIPLLPGDMGDMIKEEGNYPLGLLIINYLLVYRPLDVHIPYSDSISAGTVEDYISYTLGDTVSIDEYISFVESCDLLEQFADLFVVASTNASIAPPTGGIAYRDKLLKEYRDKYGDLLDTDIRLLLEIEQKMVAYDTDYLKDDPTYGVLLNPQMIGNARKNLYGIIGAELDTNGNMTPVIPTSLMEGAPVDKRQLASIFNSSVNGSISRGFLTQYTGADANVTARVLNAITVTPDSDCKSKRTKEVLITKENHEEYIFYNIMISGKPLMLTVDNIQQYINQVVHMRTYAYCIEPDGGYCSICSGRQGADNSKIASILSTENNGILTNSSMKAMHDKTMKLVKYDMHKALY